MSVNKVILLGRIGQDPELKYTPNGNAVCNFSLATSESYTDKATNEKKESTEWSRVVVWGKLAELCNKHLSKGKQAYVEGKLQTRSWEEQETGKMRYATEILARTVQFIDGMVKDENQQNLPTAKSQDYTVPENSNFKSDDIPF